MSGTAESIAAAEWLFAKLDRQSLVSLTPFDEFEVPGSADKVAISYPPHPKTPDLMEQSWKAMQTAVSLRYSALFGGGKVILMRGAGDGIKLAEWMLLRLDQAPGAEDQTIAATIGGKDQVVKILYSGNHPDSAPLKEIVQAIRTVGDIIRVAPSRSPDAIVVNESRPERAELAAWVFHQMDQPLADRFTATHEYRLADVEDGVVRLFYLEHADTPETIRELSTAVRTATRSLRLQIFPVSKILAMRGTPASIPLAERTIAEKDRGSVPPADTPLPTTFNLASVKPARPGENSASHIRADGIDSQNQSLAGYISMAYSLAAYQLRGPNWITTERYDIAAKAAGPVPDQQMRIMLQALLAERFHLMTHRESQELQGYSLVAKSGLKVHPVPANGASPIPRRAYRNGLVTAIGEPMEHLRIALEGLLNCPIEDATHVDGVFDWNLRWTPDPVQSGLFDVLEEQLGLKLEKRKMLVDLLVVDSADKAPREN